MFETEINDPFNEAERTISKFNLFYSSSRYPGDDCNFSEVSGSLIIKVKDENGEYVELESNDELFLLFTLNLNQCRNEACSESYISFSITSENVHLFVPDFQSEHLEIKLYIIMVYGGQTLTLEDTLKVANPCNFLELVAP